MLLAGSIDKSGPEYVITARAVDTSGETQWTRRAATPAASEVLAAVGRLAFGIRESLGETASSLQTFPAGGTLGPNSLTAFRSYADGVKHSGNRQWQSAAEAFSNAVEHDPTFGLAHLMLAQALRAEAPGQTRAYLSVAARAASLAENGAANEIERYFILATYRDLLCKAQGPCRQGNPEHPRALALWEALIAAKPNHLAGVSALVTLHDSVEQQARWTVRRAAILTTSFDANFAAARALIRAEDVTGASAFLQRLEGSPLRSNFLGALPNSLRCTSLSRG